MYVCTLRAVCVDCTIQFLPPNLGHKSQNRVNLHVIQCMLCYQHLTSNALTHAAVYPYGIFLSQNKIMPLHQVLNNCLVAFPSSYPKS